MVLFVGETRAELGIKKDFFEKHLKTLNNIKIDAAGKIDETARKNLFEEAKDVCPSYLAFTELGMRIFTKSWNLPWKLWTYIPRMNPATKKLEILTYHEIGETAAQENPKLLLEQLRDGYADMLSKINTDLKKIRLNEIEEEIQTLDAQIRED